MSHLKRQQDLRRQPRGNNVTKVTKAFTSCRQRHARCFGGVPYYRCTEHKFERIFIDSSKKRGSKKIIRNEKVNYLKIAHEYSKLSKKVNDLNIVQNEDTMVWENLKAEFRTSNIKEFDYSLFNIQKQIGNGEFSIVYSADLKGEMYEQCNNNHEDINPSLTVTNFSETKQNMPTVEYNKENSSAKLNESLEVKSDILILDAHCKCIQFLRQTEPTLENTAASQVDNDINSPPLVPKSDVTVTIFNSIKHYVRRRRRARKIPSSTLPSSK
ncbi:6897_t:CDS:2 [Dentiscutata heterogama]|uniref:6897_t:CDS:1 n=1 Tax=Dentiscutata heterogama TaxID=1316150 RepID=A0ACA9K544_9GLOM|nr:6897_t:CDS:2 [Dentiscutata heterogama]